MKNKTKQKKIEGGIVGGDGRKKNLSEIKPKPAVCKASTLPLNCNEMM
jgi:hypothetical protein